MPIYEYRCADGHVFDVIQRISDEALTACQECGAPAERVLHPVAVHFKGSGFYTTDYARGKGAGSGNGAGEGAETGADGEKGAKDSSGSSDGSGSKSSESKGSDAKKAADSKPKAGSPAD